MTTLLLDEDLLERARPTEYLVAEALGLVAMDGWAPTVPNVIARLAASYTARKYGPSDAFVRAYELLEQAINAQHVVVTDDLTFFWILDGLPWHSVDGMYRRLRDEGPIVVDYGDGMAEHVGFMLRFYANAVGPTQDRRWNNATIAEMIHEDGHPYPVDDVDVMIRLVEQYGVTPREAAELVGWAYEDGALR